MVFTWIIFLLAAMVHVRDTGKPKRAKRAKKTRSDSETDSDTELETDFIDWDNLEIEGGVPSLSKGKAPANSSKPTKAEKGKAPMDPNPVESKRKTGARRRSARGISIEQPAVSLAPPRDFISSARIKENEEGSGIQITESLSRAHWIPSESPWAEDKHASSATTTRPATSRRNALEATVLAAIHQDQRRLSADQESLALGLRQMATELKQLKKKCSKLSRMLKGILNKIDDTSSDSSDLA